MSDDTPAGRYRRYADRVRAAANGPATGDPACPDGVLVSAETLHHLLDAGDEMADLIAGETDA